jgi:hypothetical protein
MMTAKGEIPNRLLRMAKSKKTVPCGTCITTQYFDMSGDLVRQDIEVIVDKAALLQGATGEPS